MTTSAFSGHVEEIWISRDEWGGFLADLEDLERDRRGQAHVIAMSPGEFLLAVFATDRTGHMAAEGWIGHENLVALNQSEQEAAKPLPAGIQSTLETQQAAGRTRSDARLNL